MRSGELHGAAFPDLAAIARGRLEAARLAETRLDAARRAADRGDARETAREFEKVFAVMLVRELRRNMPAGPFGEGAGADVYEGWFDEHLGAALAEREALGLTRMIETAIGRAQAARDAAAGTGAEAGGQRP
jgi:Rod binding domain-containing protein